MNENPRLEGNVRIPSQVTARGNLAREILAKAGEPPPPAPSPAPAPPAAELPAETEWLVKAPTAEKDADPEYWKNRCNVIEGFRRADNARSTERINALTSKVTGLESKLAELSRQPAPAPPPVRTAEEIARQEAIRLRETMHTLFSEEDIEAFGEERALAQTRAYIKQGATFEEAIKQLRGEVEALKKEKSPPQSQSTQAPPTDEEEFRKAESKFFDELTAGFPTWKVVNGDQRWKEWLGQEASPGITRQDIVSQHRRNLNAGQIIKMLQAFVLSLNPSPTPAEPPETPNSSEGSGGEGPPETPEDLEGMRLLTEAEIKEGYKRKSIVGKGRFTPEQAVLFDKRVAYTMKQKGRA
jgi:hypothetical protein